MAFYEYPIIFIKEKPGKYFKLANATEIIITRRGRWIGRIISEESIANVVRHQAIDTLIGSVLFPEEYDDPDFDPDYELLRKAAYRDRGLL